MNWAHSHSHVEDDAAALAKQEATIFTIKCVFAYAFCMVLVGPLHNIFNSSTPLHILVVGAIIIRPTLTVGASFHVARLLTEIFAISVLVLMADTQVRIYTATHNIPQLGWAFTIIACSVWTAAAGYVRWGTKRGKVAGTVLLATNFIITAALHTSRPESEADSAVDYFVEAPLVGCGISLLVCLVLFPRTATNKARSILATDFRHQLTNLQLAVASAVSTRREGQDCYVKDVDMVDLRGLRRDVALEHPAHNFSWLPKASTESTEETVEGSESDQNQRGQGAPDEGQSDPVITSLEHLHHRIGCLKAYIAVEASDHGPEVSRILSASHEQLLLLAEVIKGRADASELSVFFDSSLPRSDPDDVTSMLLAQIYDNILTISKAVKGMELDEKITIYNMEDPFVFDEKSTAPQEIMQPATVWHRIKPSMVVKLLNRRIAYALKIMVLTCVLSVFGVLPQFRTPFVDYGLGWSLIIMLLVSDPHSVVSMTSMAIFWKSVLLIVGSIVGAAIGFVFRLDSVSPLAYPVLTAVVSAPSFYSIVRSRTAPPAIIVLLAFTVVLLRTGNDRLSIYQASGGTVASVFIGVIFARLVEMRWSVWTWSRSADFEARRTLAVGLAHFEIYLGNVRNVLVDGVAFYGHSRMTTADNDEEEETEISEGLSSDTALAIEAFPDDESVLPELTPPPTPAGLIPPPLPRFPIHLQSIRRRQRVKIETMEEALRGEVRKLNMILRDSIAARSSEQTISVEMAQRLEAMVDLTAGMWSLKGWNDRQRQRSGTPLPTLSENNPFDLQIDSTMHAKTMQVLQDARERLQKDTSVVGQALMPEHRSIPGDSVSILLVRTLDDGLHHHVGRFTKEAEASGAFFGRL